MTLRSPHMGGHRYRYPKQTLAKCRCSDDLLSNGFKLTKYEREVHLIAWGKRMQKGHEMT